jgi:hypothetical protein
LKKEDGAYYAIKGFLYQFDYTILTILNQIDDSSLVKIEQEQDLEYENYVVQVKHHSTKYPISKQKELVGRPTVKLLNEFSKNQNKKYCLYIHFNDKQIEKALLKIEELDDFIIKYANSADAYDDELKQNFIKNFIIDYSKDFVNQYDEVIKKISSILDCNEDLAVISHHAIIRNYLLSLVVDNPGNKVGTRETSLKKIKKLIDNNNSTIIYSEYSKILGENTYLRFLKNQSEKVDYTYNNYLFIGNNISENSTFSFSHLIQNIANKFFNDKNLSKAKPFTVVFDKPKEELKEIKKGLIRLNIKFNDGYEGYEEFSEKTFNENPLKSTKPKESSFSIRLISLETFKRINNPILPDMAYSFGNNFSIKKLFNRKTTYFSVDNIEIEQIFKLLK